MQTIKIQCPAKINLNLKITGKLENGFHAIESVMQTINLYDYLTINVENSDKNEIILSGNSSEIPYDETNLVYKASKLYLETVGIKNKRINIYIEKNIPVSAGLAGGSTDGAGVLYGLDKILRHSEALAEELQSERIDKEILRGEIFCHSEQSVESENFAPLNDESYLDNLCAKLGSDLNVCLHGGRILAQGRGEITTPLEFKEFNVSLIKPINLGISAKEAYTKYSQKNKSNNNYNNDLEWAVIDEYPQLQFIKQKYPQSVMTGSGSTYFMIDGEFKQEDGYWVKNGLKAVNFGVKEL